MSEVLAANYMDIVEEVRHWTPERRLALVQAILQTLKPELEGVPVYRSTWERAVGLLATEQPPPSAETVRAWLAERREGRYG